MSGPEFDDGFRAKLLDLFRWRRDVRHFAPNALPDGTLERLIAAATLSPSVGFSQPWRFVRVQTQARREAAIASFERANADALARYDGDDAERYARLKLSGLREAPEHLAVFCDTATATGKGLGRATMPETLMQSATMAVYTFWLFARAEHIGVGWVSILEPHVVAQALDVPPSWSLIAYLCVGYAREDADTPELLREGWESRDADSIRLYTA